MRTIYFFLVLLFLISCSQQAEKEKQLLEERILRIKNGLQPNLQIKGDSIPKYNIEERMKELGIPGAQLARTCCPGQTPYDIIM